MVIIDDEAAIRLANAIIVTAAKDYRTAIKKLKRNPKNKDAMAMAMECELFFRSDWYKALTTVDGEWLINKLRQEVVNI